jgi:alkanesulfonate monooxygenase SsuD/methylene tetrahydromethanopterin reductase-like flavin-dependent oxidoreductase (luciferase family)
MQFGLLYEMEPGEPFSREREVQIFHETLGQVQLAEQLGWDRVWAVEHHMLRGYSSGSAPEVLLGWLAGQTERIRLGHAVVHAAPQVNHFWRIAERAATLDVLSKGRLDLGTGRGFSPNELRAFGVDPSTTRPAQVEVVKMLQEVFLEETFTWQGEFYSFDEAWSVHPKPVQDPHPPLYMACTQPATWDIASDLGIGVLSFGDKDPVVLREKISRYKERVQRATPKSGRITSHVAFAPNLYCAPTDEEALETAAEHQLYFSKVGLDYVKGWKGTTAKDYQFYQDIGEKLLDLTPLPESETRGLSPAAAAVKPTVKNGIAAIGSPDTIREFIQGYVDAGVDEMIFVVQFGQLADEDIQRSMKLASEVLSEFSDNITVRAAAGA